MTAVAPARPVTAIIVTYQSAQTIRKTVAAARRCYDAELLDAIIVDNGSPDDTLEIVKLEASWARVVVTGNNNGFAKGCNIGLALVSSPFTVFLNPDAVVEPDAIRVLLSFMEQHPNVGIVGPAILEGEDSPTPELQFTGRRPTPWTMLRDALPLRRRKPISWRIVPGSAPAATEWVCGAALLIRTELLKRLGGFDPRFFLYWEEMDLCKRAEDLGFETWTVGAAVARHVGGASSSPDDTRIAGCIAKHYFRSRYYYMIKHHGWLAATISELGEFVLVGLRALSDAVLGRGLRRIRPRLQAPLLSMPELEGDGR
jgi:N-acetylglucosaminyl-diphospho-decaprenol L-rhamnosyltransferase